MTVRGVFFIGLFGVCSLLALGNPFMGIVAYTAHYHSFPERSWWGGGLAAMGIRYSYTITACLALGTLLNFKRLPYGRLITRQEALYLAFLAWMFVLGSVTGMKSATFRGGATGTVDAVDKMIKSSVFVLALTHIVVTPKRLIQYTWLLVFCAIYLGYEAYTAPAGAYFKGRLEGVGGPDFGDANALAAHMIAILPIIGVRYINSRALGKGVTLIAAGFAANTVVATRSRAGFLAASAGVLLALATAPKQFRRKIWPLLIAGIVGFFMIADAGFIERMASLGTGKADADESAQSRRRVWNGSIEMIKDHPIGVGPSNFPAYIGNYVRDEAGRDAHQTFLRCTAELGFPGLLLYVCLIANAFRTLQRVKTGSGAAHEEYRLIAYAIQLSLLMYLICGLFGSFIYTEMQWWLLLLPSALERIVANANNPAYGSTS